MASISPLQGEGISEEALIRKILEPVAKRLRKMIFGTEAPPFLSHAEVEAWIQDFDQRRKAEIGNQAWKERQEKSRRLEDKLRQLCEELGALNETDVSWQYETRLLPYLTDQGEELASAVACGVRQLLATETATWERITGFSQAGLVDFVLTGAKPRLSPITVTARSEHPNVEPFKGLRWNRLTVQINSNDISGQLLQYIGRLARNSIPVTTSKIFTAADESLIEAYDAAEAVSKELGLKRAEFWQELLHKCNVFNIKGRSYRLKELDRALK